MTARGASRSAAAPLVVQHHLDRLLHRRAAPRRPGAQQLRCAAVEAPGVRQGQRHHPDVRAQQQPAGHRSLRSQRGVLRHGGREQLHAVRGRRHLHRLRSQGVRGQGVRHREPRELRRPCVHHVQVERQGRRGHLHGGEVHGRLQGVRAGTHHLVCGERL